ncbi:alpha/beta hydrolase [Rhizobiaceae bacterium BDR2-2]|uniref:Alpha/beta hydrolase n=1 Tax=Ectorhizobium quercum TaxID=2965071 RepID=A0AAE3N2D2_9HYPH|nr:alpha/beta hydrolase [Ectorhizobium quercum]MCX8996290.1 alpha/beta hydrolase [Ectorhizobium quercum]MCX8998671.1 alpha/beta hydrolase [Ectorhizobium quercum]
MTALFSHESGRYLDIGDARIYYEVRGNEAGEPLVLLHGGLGSIEDFNPILPGLADTYRLIGIDSRGQGKSTLGREPLTYARLEKDAVVVIRHLGVETAGIVGFSDGGITALRLAANGDVTPRRVVTIGAHWALGADDPARALYADVTAESWQAMFPESCEAYLRLNPEPDFERLTRTITALWLDDGPDGYPGETVRAIACPLLAVRGDEDRLVSRENALELVERVPNTVFLNLPFADHSAQDDQPAILLWALQTFLNRN